MKEGSPKDKRASLYISDGVEIKLLSIPDDLREKLGENWSHCSARIRNNVGTYRFVNYLTSTGLLVDRREISGVGWRKLSYVDCIYLELVVALRRLGVKSGTIKYLYKTFQEEYTKKRAGYTGLDWLDILITVHAGTEMEVLITNNEITPPIIADPAFMYLTGTQATEGQIRVSLSTMVNNVREQNGMKPIKIKDHFGQLGLSDAEFETMKDVRSLSKNETITIKKQNKGTLIERVKQEKSNEDLASRLATLVGEEFGSINAQVEGGKVVSIQKSAKKVIPNE